MDSKTPYSDTNSLSKCYIRITAKFLVCILHILSTYIMQNRQIVGVLLQLLFERLDSHEVIDHFRGRNLDEELVKKFKEADGFQCHR